MTSSSQVLTFSTLILGEGPLVIPCAETLLRHKHTIQAIVSTNDVIQDWAQEQKIPWVARQDDLLSAVDGRPILNQETFTGVVASSSGTCRSDRQRRGTAAAPTYRSSQSRCQ
jgi:hypothetical protein